MIKILHFLDADCKLKQSYQRQQLSNAVDLDVIDGESTVKDLSGEKNHVQIDDSPQSGGFVLIN